MLFVFVSLMTLETGQVYAADCYEFNNFLAFGNSRNVEADVSALHDVLIQKGINLGDTSGGFFTEDTADAVKEFQELFGLESTGFVGADTRLLLSQHSGCVDQELLEAATEDSRSSSLFGRIGKAVAKLFTDTLDEPESTTGQFKSALKSVDEEIQIDIAGEESAQVATLPTVGEQKLLVLPILFEESPEPLYSREMLEAEMLGQDSFFQRFYKEVSYGKIFFSGTVAPWTRVNRSQFINGKCRHFNPIAYPTDQPLFDELVLEKDINLEEYNRLVIVSYFTECGNGNADSTSAQGTEALTISAGEEAHTMSLMNVNMNAEKSPFTLIVSNKPEMNSFDHGISHEFGHNLGLGHANGLDCYPDSISGNCKLKSYGNPFDMMGGTNGGMHFNAVFKERLGWLVSADIVSVEESGTYTLKPLEGSTGKRAARINLLDGGSYYVEFRNGSGFNERMNETSINRKQKKGIFINKTAVEYGSTVSLLIDTTRTSDSWLIDAGESALLDDNIFVDEGNGITIGPITSVSEDEISFNVALGDPECVTGKAKITVAQRGPFDKVVPGGKRTVRFKGVGSDTVICPPREFTLESVLPTDWDKVEPQSFKLQGGNTENFEIEYKIPPLSVLEKSVRRPITIKVKDDNNELILNSGYVFSIAEEGSVPDQGTGDIPETVNVFASKPSITGDPVYGADDRILAGNMSISTEIRRSGSIELSEPFSNVLQYSQDGENFHDWVSFDLPELLINTQAAVKYSWKGGEGVWYFRVCVDNTGLISESDEDDNCSSSVRIHVVPKVVVSSGDLEPVDPSNYTGPANLEVYAPVFLGRVTGLYPEIEGYMKIAARVHNTGGKSAPAPKSMFQYSVNGKDFFDWLEVYFPELGPGETHTASYGWKGGEGTWHFRLCLEGTSNCSPATTVEIEA